MDSSSLLEQLLNLFSDYKNQQLFLNIIQESIVSAASQESTAHITVSSINKLLATALKRQKGFILLEKTILHYPKSIVISNASSWINLCVNYNLKEPPNAVRFQILSKLMTVSAGDSEFQKCLLPMLPMIIDMCISANPTKLPSHALKCLEVCVLKYPSACSPYKTKLEAYLLKYLSATVPDPIVLRAGNVMHYLQQVGSSGAEGNLHVTNWCEQLKKLCATIYNLYNVFFANVVEFEVNIVAESFIKLPLLESDSSVPYVTALALRNIIIFIDRMLLEPFPVQKNINLELVLNVIKRGLLVDTFSDLGSSEEVQYATLLYRHQIKLLHLLQSLIVCYKETLLGVSFTISKILTNCLQRTKKKYFKNQSEYQKAVHETLRTWITVVQNNLSRPVHNNLVGIILPNIVPSKSDVKLYLNEHSKKKRKQTSQEAPPQGDLVSETPNTSTVKEVLCAEALKTLSVLIQNVTVQLENNLNKLLLDATLQQLLNFCAGKFLHPYRNQKCQALLYELLSGLLLQPSFCKRPLIQTATNIFSRQLKSSNGEIGAVCQRGLDVLEKISQPLCPTLNINFDDEVIASSRKRRSENTNNKETSMVNGITSPTRPPLPKVQVLEVRCLSGPAVASTQEKDKKPVVVNLEEDVNNSQEIDNEPIIAVGSEEHDTGIFESTVNADNEKESTPTGDINVSNLLFTTAADELDSDEERMLNSFRDVLNK